MRKSESQTLKRKQTSKAPNPENLKTVESLAKPKERLSNEILRIEAHLYLKQAQSLWGLQEKQLCESLARWESLPTSKVKVRKLFGASGVQLLRTDNKIYLGEVDQKKRHGNGILINSTGKIYEGQFLMNQRCGHGCELYTNENFYVGGFLHNKKHGFGVFYWFNLSTKESLSIEHYSGEWWGGLPDGKGQHHKQNGDHYKGIFKNGLKHGQGTQNYGNGDRYQGQFVNSLPEGYGLYVWRDGSNYKGEFKQGYRNGYGVWKGNHKDLYKGHYLLDKKQGYGEMDFGNGYSYEGHFSDDLRSGVGQLFFKNKVVYSGKWKEDKREVIVEAHFRKSLRKKKSHSFMTTFKHAPPPTKTRVSHLHCIPNLNRHQKSYESFKKPSKSVQYNRKSLSSAKS